MFKNIDIKKLKDKYKEDISKKNKRKKTLEKLGTYLNTFDYNEFMSLYIPKNINEIKLLIKPLPFLNYNRNELDGISIPFSKHLSRDIKLNCRKNIDNECPICDVSTIKKFDFVIFPVFVLSSSNNSFFKNKIKLIELPLLDWDKYIFPNIENYYTDDLLINLTIKKDKYNYNYIYKNELIKIKELTEEEIYNKSFIYEKIKNYLYNEKAYVKEFNLELDKNEITIKKYPF